MDRVILRMVRMGALHRRLISLLRCKYSFETWRFEGPGRGKVRWRTLSLGKKEFDRSYQFDRFSVVLCRSSRIHLLPCFSFSEYMRFQNPGIGREPCSVDDISHGTASVVIGFVKRPWWTLDEGCSWFAFTAAFDTGQCVSMTLL